MPNIQVILSEHYEESVRSELSVGLTAATCSATGANPESVSVAINEVPAANDTHGEKDRQPGTSSPSASETVRAYLTAMEALDYQTSNSFLAEGFTMTFPGDVCFTTPQELAEWGRERYRFVKKSYQCFDELHGNGTVVVYCHGTLGGEWLDGTVFSGIRFIDRFTIVDNKLVDQKVWNDFGQVRPE